MSLRKSPTLTPALLASRPALHPVLVELAELSIQMEIDICAEYRMLRERENERKNSFLRHSKLECY